MSEPPFHDREDRSRTRRRLVRDLLKVLALAIVFLLLAWAVETRLVHEFFDIDHWRQMFSGGHHVGSAEAGILLFVLAGSLLIAAGLPRLLVAAVGGGIYGALFGALLSLLSALIAAIIIYFVGHGLLRDMVDRRFRGRLAVWRARLRQRAFWWVLYTRLFPFTNSTLNSLLCGACDVPFWPFLAASFLGFIPQSVVFALFGSGGATANYLQIAVAVGLLLVTMVLQIIFYRMFPDAKAEPTVLGT